MVINKIGEDQYYVICDGRVAVLSLDEVMALLRHPRPDEQLTKKFNTQDLYEKD